MEYGMENSEPGSALTTARHWPSQDHSAGPGCVEPWDPARPGHPHAPHDGHEECDLVTVPARQGLEAVDILRRGAGGEAVGPVLHDGGCDTLGFLVPPGTADGWDLPGSACTQTFGRGASLAPAPDPEPVPPPPPVAGTGWLVPPGDTDPVTDPAVLRAALGEAARMIEAADNCR
ncbi:hypothetical protein STRAU_7033 [Streptomyces aurantiacus JA 4570]|uniref:Uncharacterized protein n=2 Tax=Streptomyces aurantiacus TaxID=47760 RepID=S3ZNH6_9ACTN|nr:hypothetical protein STRAU_7033 [Streptomyces aurantiacus JA 4570]